MIAREILESEIPEIAEIERECFAHPWSENSIKETFMNKSDHFYAAEADGKIVGYIGVSIAADEGYILNVATKPDCRRRGAAKALLNYIINVYEKKLSFLTLEVRPSNIAAIKLYESFGFEKVGERKNYYRNPVENALLLTKWF
ncbi:MAG: ribosomal protein S18-alanine N-acetyltransferase [Ruminococcus sp.]|nr:ribosomal protein S18-alanine N-acetyltransferase [Ruminococcus sp.]